MSKFDVKTKAYERAMQENNYFGLKGKQIKAQLDRYSDGLRYDRRKIDNKAFGQEFARELEIERKALSGSEQTSLTEGLSGTNKSTPVSVTNVITERATSAKLEQKAPNKIKVKQKRRVGTAKTGFKFYLIDKQGNTYQVNRKTYNCAKKGKNVQIKLTMDTQAYHNQQQAIAKNTQRIASAEQVIPKNAQRITDAEQAIAKNTQRITQVEQVVANNARTIASQGNDIANLTKKLAKTNKQLAFVSAIATLATGAVGYLIGKSKTKKDSPKEGNSATVIEKEKEGNNNVNHPKNESNEQVSQTTTKDSATNNFVNNEPATQVTKQETAENIPSSDVNVSLKEQVGTTTVVALAKAEEKTDSTSTVVQSSAMDINDKYIVKKVIVFGKLQKNN